MSPRYYFREESCSKCVYDFHTPDQLKKIINTFEAGTFTRWKRFRSVGFEKKYDRASKSVYELDEFTARKLSEFGDDCLKRLQTGGKRSKHFKLY